MNRRRWLLTTLLGVSVLGAVPMATALGRGAGPSGQSPSIQAVALGAAFTYQGRLNDAGSPANGAYDLRFILYDAETGGAQVGATVTKEDVLVVNGLFTTTLDFGASSFNGDGRWVEIAVRAGTSTGNFTVLSPRQAINPVPYALYAKTAGLGLPFTGSATSAAASALLDITQAGAGSAIAGRGSASTTDPSVLGVSVGTGPGVQGTATGAGAGVFGTSSATNGIGVQGSITGVSGTAGQLTGNGAGTNALELVNGALKVGATGAKFAFDHIATLSPTAGFNTCAANATVVDDTDAVALSSSSLLFVTPVGTTAVSVSVSYGVAVGTCPTDKWLILTPATAPITAGQTFNVLVVRQ